MSRKFNAAAEKVFASKSNIIPAVYFLTQSGIFFRISARRKCNNIKSIRKDGAQYLFKI